MDKNFKQMILEKRNVQFGLQNSNTSRVIEEILKYYEFKINSAERSVIGYLINIVFTNVNGLNRLGSVEKLYETWGDLYFIDLKESNLMTYEVNDEGNADVTDSINFNDISELKALEQVSFSLSKLIELCKSYNFKVNIYSREDMSECSVIEINILKSFFETDSIVKYLNLYEEVH